MIKGVMQGAKLAHALAGEFYLKSEADKVIAEKDKEIAEQKRLRDMALASVPNALKVAKIIQHNKYKRCLAMARYCRSVWSAIIFIHEGHGAEHYMKWENRWLELANKFKETK